MVDGKHLASDTESIKSIVLVLLYLLVRAFGHNVIWIRMHNICQLRRIPDINLHLSSGAI